MAEQQALVIFGATGDLAQKMLFPSLYFLDSEGHLSKDLKIVGFAHSKLSNEEFLKQTRESLEARTGHFFNEEDFGRLAARIGYCAGDFDQPDGYRALAETLKGIEDCVYYLSTSPNFFGAIAGHLKAAGLNHPKSRIAVEKPIGRDLASCLEIEAALAAAFSEERILRVDHYLGKETVQNLMALRFANTLFEPLWNKDSIEHVQITVAETIGVERRWSYYDSFGALRDIVQNHLLQLLCLVAMEPPANLDPDSVRNEKVKVLKSLRRIAGEDVERQTVRGQYRKGYLDDGTVPGYSEESGGAASDTETFVALSAHIDNWRWAGVPFYLRTGKRLAKRTTQIAVQFRRVPHSIFPRGEVLPNRLTMHLQPEEEISLQLMNKTPTLESMQLKPLSLNLSLLDAFKRQRQRIAYERLLMEALAGSSFLFVRRDEVEASWKWIDDIIEGWKERDLKPSPYTAGTWGPPGAFALIERNGHTWYE